ncbi:hypothetical protein [Saccharomonospora xinjiangensis]|uniref:PE domain-containing protein n=1 Tax=Saccharomonospora xinjiangensis XJ-54 TaxID=882086 RepID=I0UZS9_9PSEU|nr:hypothetical protein [Saccharomonospora xinjiangensis]EID53382.1 hypothetical protein SacxiDRAFT_1123 [Saccharomonospora xinjiangensis XJ-54]
MSKARPTTSRSAWVGSCTPPLPRSTRQPTPRRWPRARAAASELVNSAKNGGFRVSKDSANELIDIMAHFVERIDNMKHDLLVFNQRPPLGNHEYGKLVAQHMYDAANGPNSARMVVHQLKEILKMSIEALQRASGQYEETESSVVDAVKRSTRSA